MFRLISPIGWLRLEHRQAHEVAVPGEDFHHLLVRFLGRHARHRRAEIGRARLSKARPEIAQVLGGFGHEADSLKNKCELMLCFLRFVYMTER
jgi:hypothetical protein